MTTDTMPTGIDIEAMAVEHEAFGFGRVDAKGLTIHGFEPEGLQAFVNAIIEHAASIAERMGLDAQSDEAKRLAVEIGAAIRAVVG